MAGSSTEPDPNAEPKGTTPAHHVTIDVAPALWSAKSIPHKIDFGDPYNVVGDCYTRSDSAQEWEIDW